MDSSTPNAAIHNQVQDLLGTCLQSSTPFTCLVEELTRLTGSGDWQPHDLEALAKEVFRLLSDQEHKSYSSEWS